MTRLQVSVLVPVLLLIGCLAETEAEPRSSVDPDQVNGAARTADWDFAAVYAAADPLERPFYFDDDVYIAAPQVAPLGDPARAALTVANANSNYFVPAGCAEVETLRDQVVYTLSECEGPMGVGKLSGMLTITYFDLGEQIAFSIGSESMTIDGADAILDISGVYSLPEDDAKRVEIRSRSRLSWNDHELLRNADGVLDWRPGSKCVSVRDAGSMAIDGSSFQFELAGYSRCADLCPSEGVLRLIGERGSAVLNFDGSERPGFRTLDGFDGEVALGCSG